MTEITVDNLIALSVETSIEVLGAEELAEFAMTTIESADNAAFWYEGSSIVMVVPNQGDGWVEVCRSNHGQQSARAALSGSDVVSGVLEPRSVGVYQLARAIESGNKLVRVPKGDLPDVGH